MKTVLTNQATLPELRELDTNTGHQNRWGLVIFNNNYTPFDDVVHALMKATGCTAEEAGIEAWEAHTFGKAWVHFGAKEDCEAAGSVMLAIGVQVEVRKEWDSPE